MLHSDISCPSVCHSVGNNNITGEAGNHLATVVLEHAAMTAFCGIPLASLRENSITELNLRDKGIGAPGAIVLSNVRILITRGGTPLCRHARINCMRHTFG